MSKTIKTAAIGALTAAALFTAPAAFAADSVNATVTGGSLTASFADATLSGVTTSHDVETSTGSLALTVDDNTGTGAGWSVTAAVSDFTNENNKTIPAANFSIAPGVVTSLDSQAGVTVGGGGTLDTAKPVISATAGNGMGLYTQAVEGTLTIPANSYAGTYSATLTVTTGAAPTTP